MTISSAIMKWRSYLPPFIHSCYYVTLRKVVCEKPDYQLNPFPGKFVTYLPIDIILTLVTLMKSTSLNMKQSVFSLFVRQSFAVRLVNVGRFPLMNPNQTGLMTEVSYLLRRSLEMLSADISAQY